MTTGSRGRIAFALCATLLVAARGLAAEAPPGEAWKPITVGDEKGYVVPNKVLEELGLPPRTLAPEENAATHYLEAIVALEPSWRDLDDRQLSDAFDKAVGDDPPDRLPNALLEWFETTAQARDLIGKALALDQCQFPVVADKPGQLLFFEFTITHLPTMYQVAQLTILEGRVHEINGEPERAMETYLVTFRMAAHAGQGHSLGDAALGMICHQLGACALERLLAAEKLNPERLDPLQQRLNAVAPHLPERKDVIPMERATQKQVVDIFMKDPTAILPAPLDESRRQRPYPTPLLQSRAWRIVFPDRVLKEDCDRICDCMAEMAELPPWEAMAQWRHNTLWEKAGEAIHDWNVLGLIHLPISGGTDSEFVNMRTRHEALRLNVAMRRHKAAHGAYPETLDALGPEWIDPLPPDPFSGESFHYRLDEGKWTLWSVGFDQDDDGGNTTARYWPDDGDLVWDSAAERGTKCIHGE